jgi:hypothetical protein
MNPGGCTSEFNSSTSSSVGDVVGMETKELLLSLATEERKFGERKQEALEILVCPDISW